MPITPQPARIYQPTKNAMQSGRKKTKKWLLEFMPDPSARYIEHVMGWTGSRDTSQQVRLGFDLRDDAVAFAEHYGIPYHLEEPASRKQHLRAYADNFSFNRIQSFEGLNGAPVVKKTADQEKKAVTTPQKATSKKPTAKTTPAKAAKKATAEPKKKLATKTADSTAKTDARMDASPKVTVPAKKKTALPTMKRPESKKKA